MLQQMVLQCNYVTNYGNVGNVIAVLQRLQTTVNEQCNNGVAGNNASYANSRTAAANTFFPNWEHVHPLHDRLIKKTEVNNYCRIM